MKKRNSLVKQVHTISLANSAVFNIGDTHQTTARSRAIAVQKEGPTFQMDLRYEHYPIFQRQPKWPNYPKIVRKNTSHHNPNIHVNQVNLIGVSASSIFQIGSISHTNSDARIKHFRLLRESAHEQS